MSRIFLLISLLLIGTSAVAEDSYYRRIQKKSEVESCLEEFEKDTDILFSKRVKF
jgi:hypothetical protein